LVFWFTVATVTCIAILSSKVLVNRPQNSWRKCSVTGKQVIVQPSGLVETWSLIAIYLSEKGPVTRSTYPSLL